MSRNQGQITVSSHLLKEKKGSTKREGRREEERRVEIRMKESNFYTNCKFAEKLPSPSSAALILLHFLIILQYSMCIFYLIL